MDPEAEVIKQQMAQTRASLAEKLETLEQQVVGTVQSTTSAVSGTVENVTETVQETVATVKETVQETMQSVKDAFDVSRQVDRHPWLILGGSVCLGYVGGRLLAGRAGMPGPQGGTGIPARASGLLGSRAEMLGPPTAAAPARAVPGWLAALAATFAPEIDKLKRLAIGTTMGLVRDKIAESAPPHMQPRVVEILDDLTLKLGGEPAPAHLTRDEVPGEHRRARVASSIPS